MQVSPSYAVRVQNADYVAMPMLAENSTLTYARPVLLIRACTSRTFSCESGFR